MLKAKGTKQPTSGASAFDLEHFFPYRVRLFYLSVLGEVSAQYQTDFGLSVSEWRVMVILGSSEGMAAVDVSQRSSMDKVATSRAVTSLLNKGHIRRRKDSQDRRRALLSLSKSGKAIFTVVVPRMLALEQRLLAGFSDVERHRFLSYIERVRENAGLECADTAALD